MNLFDSRHNVHSTKTVTHTKSRISRTPHPPIGGPRCYRAQNSVPSSLSPSTFKYEALEIS